MKRIQIIDSHTGGEPTRLVVGGFPDLGAGSMAERRERLAREHDAWRAATVGEMIPGRRATRNFRRWVTGISEAATSQESSQERPVGISTPP